MTTVKVTGLRLLVALMLYGCVEGDALEGVPLFHSYIICINMLNGNCRIQTPFVYIQDKTEFFLHNEDTKSPTFSLIWIWNDATFPINQL